MIELYWKYSIQRVKISTQLVQNIHVDYMNMDTYVRVYNIQDVQTNRHICRYEPRVPPEELNRAMTDK